MVYPGGTTTTECELVVRGAVGNDVRGWLLGADGMFHPDSSADPAIDDAALRAIGRAGSLTYTCAPPGSGVRMAHDRDEDGTLDGDERLAGTDPASRPIIEIPNPTLPEIPLPMPDAGMAELDAGMPGLDAGPPVVVEDGCGCRAGSRGDRGAWWPLLAALALFRRRSR
jgi:MYXO-CTERM domain-containing protein